MVKILLILVIIISYCVPSQVSAHSQTQVIEMTPNGFEPQSVTIDTNSTVIFINKDSKARWPASNIHPTHELYPEFDPRRPIAAGESWPFKPKKAGEWKYHDHLLPHQRGSLTVISEGQVAGVSKSSIIDRVKSFLDEMLIKIKNIFHVTKKDQQVLGIGNFTNLAADAQIKVLKEMAEKEDVEKVWQFVKATFTGQAGSSGNIHDLAHLAGALIYEKKGFSGVGFCSSQFAFGCFHGFLDKAFAKNLDQLTDAHDACLKLGPDGSGPVASCIHGIGHGVASYFSTSDIKKSLAPCRKLTSGQEYCFDGVFMEYVRSAPDTAFKKEDPLYPCDSLEKEFGYTYSFACGRNQPSMLMSRFKLGFDEVVGICLNATSTPFKQACSDSLGFSLASQGQALQIIEGCQKIGIAEFIARCIKAAAGELVFQEVPNWQEKSQAVCNSVLVGRDECLSHLDRLILEYNRKISLPAARQEKTSFTPIKNGEDLNLYLRREIKKCYDTGGAGGCYKDVAELFYDQLGFSKTLELLKANENSPEVYARCHEVTHYLSRSEYQKQKSIAKVYAQCDSTCHGGCYHGTLEAYLKEQELKAGFVLTDHFPQVCGKKKDYQKPLEFNECLHGMGHAAMFVTDMELRESLSLCDTIEDIEQRDRCFTGVFMENSSSSTSFDHQSRYIKTDDPYFPCNSLDEKYQSVCWQYQSSYFSIINNQNWVKVSDMCLQIPEKYQDKCFRTIGTNQVGFTPSLLVMKQDCDLMPSEHFKDVCIGGVVSSLSYRFVGDISRIVEFCSLVDSPNQETCYKQMGYGIADWVADKNMVKVECGKIPDPKGQNWCAGVI